MKRKLLMIGIIILLIPVITGIYKMFVENWSFLDWIILYSAIYYPTYIIAFICMIIGLLKK